MNDLTPEEEEAKEAALDRMRGGPRKYLKDLANECGMDLDHFMHELNNLVESHGHGITLGIGTPFYDVQHMWDCFELVTKKHVPAHVRNDSYPISCAC